MLAVWVRLLGAGEDCDATEKPGDAMCADRPDAGNVTKSKGIVASERGNMIPCSLRPACCGGSNGWWWWWWGTTDGEAGGGGGEVAWRPSQRMVLRCGDVMTRSRLKVPAASMAASSFAIRSRRAFPAAVLARARAVRASITRINDKKRGPLEKARLFPRCAHTPLKALCKGGES